VGVALFGALLGTGVAQQPAPSWWRARLEHGTLTVWVVSHATNDDKIRLGLQKLNVAIQPNKVVLEKTMSEFGTSASAVGQTSGSYGQTAGSLGTSASDAGQTAGSVGKPASEFGGDASANGQTAGSYGQTAGSFGTAPSNYGVNASDSNRTVAAQNRVSSWSAEQGFISAALQQDFPGISVQSVHVFDVEFKDRLAAVRGTAAYPDVIFGLDSVPGWWQSGLGVTMLGEPSVLESSRLDPNGRYFRPGTVDLLRAAPHADVARAFWVWMTRSLLCRSFVCDAQTYPPGAEEPVRVAQGALRDVLDGVALGSAADKDAAEYVARSAQAAALASDWGDEVARLVDERVQMEVLTAFVSGRIAAVSLRAVVDAENAFGVLNAMVVLHRADDGRWRVLQISPKEPVEHRKTVFGDLRTATQGGAKDGGSLQPVSLAAPLDGDTRTEGLGLWWDNNGQARLQVVEWQAAVGSGWGSSALLTVPDTNSRVQTRVTASFAFQGSTYRWRVWSVGKGGALAITGWRTFTVVGR
jgi:hypothetical protein